MDENKYPSTIKITLTLGNDAFCTNEHVASALRQLVWDLENKEWDVARRVKDINGNIVGTVELVFD